MKAGRPSKITYDDIYKLFKDNECILLDKKYYGMRTRYIYMCKCGNVSLAYISNFKKNKRCKECAVDSQKLTYEYVNEYFTKEGCELLEEKYINNHTKMKYICKNKHITKTTFNDLQTGYKCKICYLENKSGENHHNWNPNREEINIHDRIRTKKHKSWIKNHMKEDKYYNQYLITPKEFHIDHIIPVSIFSKFVYEFGLNEEEVKKVINKRDNLQLLPAKENMSKKTKCNPMEALKYLIKHNIQFNKGF